MERPGAMDASMKDITQEEVSKLTRAMKDSQFQSHMDDYCKEISDPAHRKEYLQYLDQLEAKGEMPEGQQLLRTEPGLCVKTNIKFKNGQNQKCFINIVHCDRIQDMSEMPDEKGGKRVSLPYSLGPPRPERDNKDENCMTCDFAVSTWTFGQAIQRPQILKMLVDTASDGLGGQFLKGHEEVKKDFKVMRRIKCRGPGARPLPMSVKAELLKDKGKWGKLPSSSVEAKSAVTPSELKQMREDAKAKQLKPPAPKDDSDEDDAPKKVVEVPEPTHTASGALRIRVPKHKLIHSGAYDLTDFMLASNRPSEYNAQSVPRVLKLVVELPSVKKASDVVLDVTPFNVCIEVPDKYYLDLPLSYEIDDENGDAKFDKVKQTLTLELPVKPKLPDPNLLANRGEMPTEGDVEDDDGDGALSEGGNSQEELPPLEDPPATEEESAQPPPCEPQPASKPPAQQARREVQQPEPLDEDLVPEEELSAFIASDWFDGKKPGYYFGKGDDGLGYYRDSRQRRPVREGRPEPSQASASVAQEAVSADGAPLIEEIEEFDFVSAGSAPAPPAQRAPLSSKAQQYVDATSSLMSRIAASDIEDTVDSEPSVDVHQTRQNLLLLVGVSGGHEVAGLQLSFVGRRLAIAFCTRPIGATRWRRHHLRRTLCRGIDIRQWHAEPPKASGDGNDAELVIVLRKAEQGDRWPEVFDTSAAAVAEAIVADREPLISDAIAQADAGIDSADNTAAPDTAAGADFDAVEDSAELDIAAPAGAPVALGPTTLASVKDVAASGSPAPWNALAASAAAQSASVMGQAVLLRTRLMYQLF